MAKTTSKLIPLAAWAAKNGVTVRTAQRMAADKRIPTSPIAVYIRGVPANFKIKKA